MKYTDEIGIDFQTDTYDAGLHLNLSGAEKLTKYFGKILSDEFNLADRRDDEQLSKVWIEKEAFYIDIMEKQYAELEELGYIKAFNSKKNEE